jgi:TatD DNase family protein
VIDTHAHLDACADPLDALVARAREAGVDRIVTIGSGIESCGQALAAAEAHTGVYASLGIHPHQAGGEETARVPELRQLLANKKAVAVGEAGLDFYRDLAPHDRQLDLFHRQLELAGELSKPVVVHSRDAGEATAAALDRFAGTVVLHCFSSPELLAVALERDYYVSFAGNVTYPRAAELRDAAARIPAHRILAETDSPYLAPQPVRGRPNEPSHVRHTIAALADVRGVDSAELAQQIDANASACFSL